jgi:hypothetical protein
MGRIYEIPIVPTASPAAAFDAFELLAASGKPFILHEIVLGQSSDYGDAAAEGLSVQIKRATGSYTSGSGGSSVTPTKNTNDPAAAATADVMNTTQALVGSGTLTTLRAEPFNVQAGYQYLPPPEQRKTFLPSEACIVSVSAPADAVTISGTAVIEEL